MERQRLMVGYDLCADYSQISYYNTEKEEPDSVNFDGQNEIPTVLFMHASSCAITITTTGM